MNRDEFNAKQLQAIDVSINKDVLISAAAGSGKTKTLSTKVFEIINNKEIKPSELLVLTFTKNAAHEMKNRIIKTFIDNKQLDLANEMKSCHIQTFDSFSLELVKKYSGRLNIADTISIVQEDIIKLKRYSLLDEILDEYYNNDFSRITKMLKKFNSKDDRSTKDVIVDLSIKLDKLPTSKRLEFINGYEMKYLSVDKFNEFMDKYINHYKDEMKKHILKVFINYKTDFMYESTKSTLSLETIDKMKEYLEHIDNFNLDYKNLVFDDEAVSNLYMLYLEVLKMNPKDFIEFAFKAEDYDEFKNMPKKPLDKKVFKQLMKLFVKDSARGKIIFDNLKSLRDFDSLYEEYYDFKDDISLLLEIVEEIDKKLTDYKKISGSFTYNDISKFTYKLLTDKEYFDIQDALRKEYKYIMVDEYQDSNDYQESLINSLLQLSETGSRSHLFCVGDVKQSIYAFRNSKVELFRNRQALYSNNDSNTEVIDMNYNYRSGEGLINDINYLFESYMRIDNGNINYASDTEKLHYDKLKNVYSKKYGNFRVERLLNIFESNKINEAKAIVSDIKNKIENHYQVYDKKDGIRDCKYSDFCIITRTKKGFNMYQKLFYENNIPLNLKVSDVITEIDPIIVLQSIFTLIEGLMNNTENLDIKHLFASLARSYIYQYSDGKLHNILLDSNKIYSDKIYLDVKQFINDNINNSFDIIYLNAINYFGIISKAHLIGDLTDLVNKIESLFSLVLSQKHNGEGLKEFVELFKVISKNKIDISGETNINNENAVDMMTIHASKGLERKIVYLPSSYNNPGSSVDRADYIFSKEFGIILHNYLSENSSTILHEFYGTILKEDKEDTDEYVRLLYVAFTRAENTCIIVGDSKKGLYSVYDNLPYYYQTDEAYLEKLRRIIPTDVLNEYYDSIKLIIDCYDLRKLDLSKLSDLQISLYRSLFEYFLDAINEMHYNLVKRINASVISYYTDILNARADRDDIKAMMFGFKLGFMDIKSVSDLYDKIIYLKELEALDEEGESVTDIETIDDLLVEINEFYASLKEDDVLSARYFIYALDNIDFYMEKNYSFYGFNDVRRYALTDNLTKEANKPNFDLSIYKIYDNEISFDPVKTFRASIKIATDEEKEIKEKLDYGTYLHHLLELIDFKTKDTSYIKDKKDRDLIDKALKLEVFNDLDKATIYKEYEYYDDLYDTVGSIDLLYIKNGIYYIIDYKSSDINKEGYINQLYTYQRNVMEKFKVKSDSIRLYLVSLSKQSFIEVNAYKE